MKLKIILFLFFLNIHNCFGGNSAFKEKHIVELEIKKALALYNMGKCSQEQFDHAISFIERLRAENLEKTNSYDDPDHGSYSKINYHIIIYYLALLYFYGIGDNNENKDWQKAFDLYKILCNQNTNEHIKISSAFYLGLIFYQDDNLRNYNEARLFLAIAYSQSNFLNLRLEAGLLLGEMYYFAHGVKENAKLAELFFEECSHQETSPRIKTLANSYLSEIKKLQDLK